MAFSFLSKFKSLGPVAVVGTAVAITVKLLTTQTPTIQESLNVVAEEDIKTVSYKDDIKEPEPEKQEPEENTEEPPADPEPPQEQEDVAEETATEESSSEASPPAEEKKKEEKDEKQKEQPKRAFKKGNKTASLIQRLLNPKKKQ